MGSSRPSRTVNARCHSKRELVHLIERRQEELVDELCDPRYSPGHIYRRGGSYTKRHITSLGMIRFRVERVVRRTDGRVYSPILEALDVKRRKYSRDVKDEVCGVRFEDELRRRQHRVLDGDLFTLDEAVQKRVEIFALDYNLD